jgi:lipopolysaccharide/colanic/teichoic acid biosynthesis glycosyltransferase
MTVHSTSIRRSAESAPIAGLGSSGHSGFYRDYLKRPADLLAVILALPVILPFMAILAFLISLDGYSPFFRQERIGKDGRRFVMWKFRTMVPDAEKILNRHLDSDAKARREWGTKQKLSSDPRVTRVGKVLRRTSLDELPQLFNVFKGDMSLIGPRPMMPCQQALYPGHAYYCLRPGMTGSWQVSERHLSDFSERAMYDDAYDAELSMTTDAGILVKTIAVVFRGTGV